MNKTKYTGGAQSISAPMGDTSRDPVSVPLPSTPNYGLPPMADQFMGAGMSVDPSANAPQQAQDSMTLPMFSDADGYSDGGVGHEGDLGGAA